MSKKHNLSKKKIIKKMKILVVVRNTSPAESCSAPKRISLLPRKKNSYKINSRAVLLRIRNRAAKIN